MLKPLEIFSNIVGGLILGFYDVVVLVVGPLIAPLRRRSVPIWRFILDVESRLTSLTLMFICTAGAVTVHAPGLLQDVTQASSLKAERLSYRFLYVLILSVILTIFFDVMLRLLVYLRTISLRVTFSRIRMVVLRLYFCLPLIVVMFWEFVAFGVWYSSEHRELYRLPAWEPTARLLIICFSALPFSISVVHLTYRLRGRAKWLAAIPLSYSLVNLLLAIGFYLGLFLAIFFIFRVDPEQVRLFAFNTHCMTADNRTVSVESDLLLKTDWYDALQIEPESVFADLGNQLVPLRQTDGTSNILISGKVIHAKWQGTLLSTVEPPKLSGQATACKIQTYGVFWSEPERVKVIEGD